MRELRWCIHQHHTSTFNASLSVKLTLISSSPSSMDSSWNLNSTPLPYAAPSFKLTSSMSNPSMWCVLNGPSSWSSPETCSSPPALLRFILVRTSAKEERGASANRKRARPVPNRSLRRGCCCALPPAAAVVLLDFELTTRPQRERGGKPMNIRDLSGEPIIWFNQQTTHPIWLGLLSKLCRFWFCIMGQEAR